MTNFVFLQAEWPKVHAEAQQAERYALSDPRAACLYARRALEQAVAWLYQHDWRFVDPYDDSLMTLITTPQFEQHVPAPVKAKAHILRKLTNKAVHGAPKVSSQQSLGALRELFHILYWLASSYTSDDPAGIPQKFDEALLPSPEKEAQSSRKELQQLTLKLQAQDEQLRQQQEAIQGYQLQMEELQTKYTANRETNSHIPIDHDYSEAQTRELIIDLLLREAGWDPTAKDAVEYPVVGMPNPDGRGKVDYVLWGPNGLPLALVEAKRTSKDARAGKQQAKLYADCLEQMHGQRPLIFYTNGYQIWLWDDQRYPERQVQGFYTQNQLELLIQRRETLKGLDTVGTNKDIAGRPYQEMAIRAVTAHLSQSFRKGLLVMATGSGKTRVAIALVDVLMRANWVKNVLFLADRQALVNQADTAFSKFAPSVVNLLKADDKLLEGQESRVVVSTYHTMMNLIDKMDAEGTRSLGPGHFDLVIVDEAHRSVYQKFGAIFAYFDGMLIGLTATPKEEIDRNTYRLFDLPDGVPTFSYDLEQAVNEGYLVPYRAFDVKLHFPQEGIVYDQLSDEEKLEWELLDWGEEHQVPQRVSPAAVNAWLFNRDTVDKALEILMRDGIHVAGGDRLGKTIIFAKNHQHALFIEERFNANYPHLAGKFARVIDTYDSYAHSLIDVFEEPDKPPHIAISVDMLDTGIDIPDVVNLVFFKAVHSKTKFWQMIGRGTRLREDLFGPGQDKTEFYVFDVCRNFEFFSLNPEGSRPSASEPLGQRLFKLRVELLGKYAEAAISKPKESTQFPKLAEALKDLLHGQVAAMNVSNFIVRPKRRWVDKFSNRERWGTLTQGDLSDLSLELAGLPAEIEEDPEEAKRFDSLMLQLQLAYLDSAPKFTTLRNAVIEVAEKLARVNVPHVQEHRSLLDALQVEETWSSLTADRLESIRLALRDLVPFLEHGSRQILYTDFGDKLAGVQEVPSQYGTAGVNLSQYRKKVEHFIKTHLEEPLIAKIRQAQPLSQIELDALELFFFEAGDVGSKDEFYRAFPNQELIPFIRSLVGLDRRSVRKAFEKFLDDKVYTANQIQFVHWVIEHLTENGRFELQLLYDRPYTDLHELGLDGLFNEEAANELVEVIAQLNPA
ncbi:MAG: DEAD/DEAH box helicase family protein [Anaerolineales bacterium]|nr:DEAD/DEAH box helicase family protein [Anaerolineales bacterium]